MTDGKNNTNNFDLNLNNHSSVNVTNTCNKILQTSNNQDSKY